MPSAYFERHPHLAEEALTPRLDGEKAIRTAAEALLASSASRGGR